MGSFFVATNSKGGINLDNIFTYDERNGEIIIIGLRKGVTETSIIIPETIDGLPVTEIGRGAFVYSTFTDIKFGKNIKKVGANAFAECERLKSIIWNSHCDEIPWRCFFACSQLHQFDFSSIKSIASEAFSKSGLQEVYLPPNIGKVSEKAFSDCTQLKTVEWKCECDRIPEYCFYNCTSLKQFDFLKINTIRENAFSCSGLQEVYLPPNIEKVSEKAFSDCTQLKTVDWKCKCNEIPKDCFSLCSALSEFDFSRINGIDSFAFSESGLQEVYLPESIENISERAFAWCKELKSVIWDSKCDKIPDCCFYKCSQLHQFDFSNIKTIARAAFWGSGLQKIHLPPNVEEIEMRVFPYCTKLNEVIWNCKYKEVPEFCFCGCASLKQFDFSSLRKLKKEAFAYSGLTSVTLGKGTEVGKRCFNGCNDLEKIKWLSARSIKGDIFENCGNIKEVFVSDKVRAIERDTFSSSPGAEITFV